MADRFDPLIADARGFFAELAQNNTRDWFQSQKSRYDAKLKAPALALLEQIAPQLEQRLDQSVKTKLFRAHRDVRFSKDKTPYTLHLHMLWAPQGSGTQPAYFFGISGDYVTAGAGLMGFDKAQQSAWRAFIAEREGAGFQSKLDALCASGATLGEPELKRVPSPFDKDHPRGALLRRKSFALHRDVAQQAAQSSLPDAIISAFDAAEPLMEDLRAFL